MPVVERLKMANHYGYATEFIATAVVVQRIDLTERRPAPPVLPSFTSTAQAVFRESGLRRVHSNMSILPPQDLSPAQFHWQTSLLMNKAASVPDLVDKRRSFD